MLEYPVLESQAWRPATLLKRGSDTSVFLWNKPLVDVSVNNLSKRYSKIWINYWVKLYFELVFERCIMLDLLFWLWTIITNIFMVYFEGFVASSF